MRLALTRLVIAAALTAAAQSGRAQESFFNERFCAKHRRRAGDRADGLFLQNLAAMHRERTRIGPLLPAKSILARASRTANGARQEQPAQSLEAP